MELTTDERAKAEGLRRMKAVALGFLLLAAAVYVVARLNEDRAVWVGFVRATAEAGMVGALADWFAVTALFRHPLRLPIPHTAIIPRKKDQLGASLRDFVGSNFLAEAVVRDKLRRAGVTGRVGGWLSQRRNAERVTEEIAVAVRGAVTVLRDEDVQEVVQSALVKRLLDQEWGPPLGRLLGQVLAEGSHRRLVDLVWDRAYDWVRDNHATVQRVVAHRAPAWSPRLIDGIVADRVYKEVLDFTWAVKTDPDHEMRQAVDTFLAEFARDLQSDPATIARAEAVKRQVVDHPDVQRLIGSAWGTAKRMLLDAAADPSSELRRRVRDELAKLGDRLVVDAELRGKVDTWLEGAAAYVVRNYASEITTLITDTVERWDAEETARKVELQVGRDLQFIRINGTVVGALAGLVIHSVGHFVL